jgi:hypothetical protein
MSLAKPADSNRSRKQPAQLASKLDKDLIAYALVAGAAGVGVMAAAPNAEARVVATPANIVVPIDGGVIQFDINGDGVPDFGLSATNFFDSSGGATRKHTGKPLLGGIFGGRLFAIPAQSANGVAVNGSYFGKPAAMAFVGGAPIGPSLPFDNETALMAGVVGTGCEGSSFAYGHWRGSHPPHEFLGVKFTDSSGKLHYGWVRIETKESGVSDFNATITGYAYETTPNMPIRCGKTQGAVSESSLMEPSLLDSKKHSVASLGMLALGAQGVTVWRREEEDVLAKS